MNTYDIEVICAKPLEQRQTLFNGNVLQFSSLTIRAVANQSGAMEAETIIKNGWNPKSQMSRKNVINKEVYYEVSVS